MWNGRGPGKRPTLDRVMTLGRSGLGQSLLPARLVSAFAEWPLADAAVGGAGAVPTGERRKGRVRVACATAAQVRLGVVRRPVRTPIITDVVGHGFLPPFPPAGIPSPSAAGRWHPHARRTSLRFAYSAYS